MKRREDDRRARVTCTRDTVGRERPRKRPLVSALDANPAAAAGWGGPQTGGRRDRQGRAAAPSTVQAPGVPLPRAIVRLNILCRYRRFLLSFFRHSDFGTSWAVPLSSNKNLEFFLVNSTYVEGF